MWRVWRIEASVASLASVAVCGGVLRSVAVCSECAESGGVFG